MKVTLQAAFRDYLEKKSLTLNAFQEALPQDLRQSRDEVHFQPLAGNEVLKGFHVKLTMTRTTSLQDAKGERGSKLRVASPSEEGYGAKQSHQDWDCFTSLAMMAFKLHNQGGHFGPPHKILRKF
ncbi:MAG: hypothetical protein V7K81_04555 [Nostoc sp.]